MRSKADFDTAKSLIEGSEEHGEVWTVAGVAEEVGVSIAAPQLKAHGSIAD
ncbi:hypothetical protein D6D08_09179, partial [Aureobasidium pullulans]